MNKRIAATVIVALALAFVVYQAIWGFPKPTPMTPQEEQCIKRISEKLDRRCLGSYQIDLPTSFSLNSASRTRIEEVDLSLFAEDRAAFQRRFNQRRAELESLRQIGKPAHPHLRAVLPAPISADEGGIFDRVSTEATSSRARRTLEVLAWKRGYTIQASVNALDNTFPEDANRTYLQEIGNEVPKRLKELEGLVARVSGRGDGEIPARPGLCIANGFVSDLQPDERIHIHTVYQLEHMPDVFLAFNQWSQLREQTSLLERSEAIEREMTLSGTRTLRKGRIDTNTDQYETWLVEGPTPDNVLGTTFTLHGNEKNTSTKAPFFELTLFNGHRVPVTKSSNSMLPPPALTSASLSASQAIALWDSFVNSVGERTAVD